jgi:hypothetical protein
MPLLGSAGFFFSSPAPTSRTPSRVVRTGRERSRSDAVGATRFRLLRQLAVESALLAGLAGVAGFGLSLLGVRFFSNAVADIAKPYWIHWSMDGRVFLFFAAVSVAAGLLFGLAPALHLSKTNLVSLKARTAAGAGRWTKGFDRGARPHPRAPRRGLA